MLRKEEEEGEEEKVKGEEKDKTQKTRNFLVLKKKRQITLPLYGWINEKKKVAIQKANDNYVETHSCILLQK